MTETIQRTQEGTDSNQTALEWMLAIIAFLTMSPYFIWTTYHGGVFAEIGGLSTLRLMEIVCICLLIVTTMGSGFSRSGCLMLISNISTSLRRIFSRGTLSLSAQRSSATSSFRLLAPHRKFLAALNALISCVSMRTLALLCVCLYVYILRAGYDMSIIAFVANMVLILMLVLFVATDSRTMARSFDHFYTIFAISLIPGIFIYTATNFAGVNIPFDTLASTEAIKISGGSYYKLYPGCVEWATTNEYYWLMPRLCAMFNEPGVVGTFAALFLAADKAEFKRNWRGLIALAGGLLSFSAAFYLLFTGVLLLKVGRRNMRVSVYMAVALIAVYIVFINIQLSSPILVSFQERLRNLSSIDNRTSIPFEAAYAHFWQSDIPTVLFGNGGGAHAVRALWGEGGTSSYKGLIYDYGLFGFFTIIPFLLGTSLKMIQKDSRNRRDALVVVIVFLASMYQRPNVLNMAFFIVLFGGISARQLALDKQPRGGPKHEAGDEKGGVAV